MRGWWNMPCWNGLNDAQQRRLIEIGNLPIGYQPEGVCPRGASVGIETESDAAPGPRFYCRTCAIDYLQDNQPRKDSTMNLDQQLFVHREAFIRTKRDMCAKYGGPYDLSHEVQITTEDGRTVIGFVESNDMIEKAVKVMADGVRSPVAFIVSMADSLAGAIDPADPRSPADRRADGDATVGDALVILALDVAMDEALMSAVRYRYDDFGQPIFDEHMTATAGPGNVLNAMRAAVGL